MRYNSEEEGNYLDLRWWAKTESLPKSGDTLFVSSTSPDRASLMRWTDRSSTYENAYVWAADILYDQILQNQSMLKDEAAPSDWDDEHWLIYPSYFLYRHHLELLMKSLLTQALDLGYGKSGDKKLLTSSHDIASLWTALSFCADAVLPPEAQESKTVFTSLANEMHQYDAKGEAGRYAKVKTGKSAEAQSFEGIEPLDLRNLRAVMHKMFRFLSGLNSQLAIERQQGPRHGRGSIEI
jgi:hypothetical protein